MVEHLETKEIYVSRQKRWRPKQSSKEGNWRASLFKHLSKTHTFFHLLKKIILHPWSFFSSISEAWDTSTPLSSLCAANSFRVLVTCINALLSGSRVTQSFFGQSAFFRLFDQLIMTLCAPCLTDNCSLAGKGNFDSYTLVGHVFSPWQPNTERWKKCSSPATLQLQMMYYWL